MAKKIKARRSWSETYYDKAGLTADPEWSLPRTPEAYDAMVEQMAKAMAVYTWSAATLSVRNYWRRDARRALKSIGITRPEDKR